MRTVKYIIKVLQDNYRARAVEVTVTVVGSTFSVEYTEQYFMTMTI